MMNPTAHTVGPGSDVIEPEEELRLAHFSINYVADAAFWVGSDGRLIYVNEAACRSLRYSRDELLSMSVHEINPDLTQEEWPEKWRQIKKRHPIAHQTRHLTKDGRVLQVEVTANHVELGGKEYLCAFAHDISERKRLEQQLLQAQKMEAVGQLAVGVAHDFNNLLTAITSYAELAGGTLPAESNLNLYLHEIQKAAETASHLTRQLLAYSRSQTIEPKVINLNDLVLNMDRMLRPLIGADVELVTLPGPDLGLVEVDPAQIELVLMNLAVNARDAMPNGGKLIIETANITLGEDYATHLVEATPGPYVTLTVSDTGVGMTQEVKAHIFEPFFTTKEEDKGTGLGLPTCYGIVAQSRGHIVCYTEPGQGTTFRVYLPRSDEVAGSLPQPDAAGYLAGGSETVLLVEDEPVVRGVAADVLRARGYSVLDAANGHEALSLARKHASEQIDLLLTDVVMPLMGGRELAERLREIHPETRVLYTSGYTGDTLVRNGVMEPDPEFMQKPFTPTVLSSKVREVLDRR